jgi:hypothetical protein
VDVTETAIEVKKETFNRLGRKIEFTFAETKPNGETGDKGLSKSQCQKLLHSCPFVKKRMGRF